MIRRVVRSTGFDIVRFPGNGLDPFADLQRFLKGQERLVIFDVGANIGQSVDKFRNSFPGSFIHSFEPSPSTYEKLKAHCEKIPGVTLWNCGVGSSNETMTFRENDRTDMSSFLEPSAMSWGSVVKSTDVQVITLDAFATHNEIDFIHVLKSDTQGFDFEVFKGANQLMRDNKIGLIYFEFIFSDMYKTLPSFDDVFRYLSDHNFALVAFYEQHFQNELIGWTDLLFISREFNRSRVDQQNSTESRPSV